MASVDVDHLRRFRSWRVMAVNCTWELVPWAHAMYAGDRGWWDRYGDGTRGFRGDRWTWDAIAAVHHRIRRVKRCNGTGLCRTPGSVNSGGNSGFQAVNLAYHLGARQIVLLGFDMHRKHGAHWHPDHENMLNAPTSHMAVWRREFSALAEDLKDERVDVVNATEGSALTCFPHMPMAQALRR